MAATVYGLTESDLAILKEVIARERRRGPEIRPNPPPGDLDHQDFFPPEVYVARTPRGGIPASVINFTATGTGTGSDLEEGPLGHADCVIYRPDVDGVPKIESQRFTKPVYNLSEKAIPAWSIILVWREKYGRWVTDGRIVTETCLKSSSVHIHETECKANHDLTKYTYSLGLEIDEAGCTTLVKSLLKTEVIGCCDCPGTGTGTPGSNCYAWCPADTEFKCLSFTNLRLAWFTQCSLPTCLPTCFNVPFHTLASCPGSYFIDDGAPGGPVNTNATIRLCGHSIRMILSHPHSYGIPDCNRLTIMGQIDGGVEFVFGSLEWNGSHWVGSAQIYLDAQVPGFPGLFCLYAWDVIGSNTSTCPDSCPLTVTGTGTHFGGGGGGGGGTVCHWICTGSIWGWDLSFGMEPDCCIAMGPPGGFCTNGTTTTTSCPGGGGGGGGTALCHSCTSNGTVSISGTGSLAGCASTDGILYCLPESGVWTGGIACGGCTTNLTIDCIDGVWWCSLTGCDVSAQGTGTGTVTFTFSGVTTNCGTGSLTIVASLP